MLRLQQKISLVTKNQIVSGTVIGIDSYSLENFDGKAISWVSYTLVSDKGGAFSRYWITDWKNDGWLLWTRSKDKHPTRNGPVVTKRSGLAKIAFSGDQGASTPFAALVVSEVKPGYYFGVERFSGSKVMCFDARKILKAGSKFRLR